MATAGGGGAGGDNGGAGSVPAKRMVYRASSWAIRR